MDRQTAIPLRIGTWKVDPAAGELSRDGQTVRVEARTMRLLLCLAQHAGEVVSIDELLNQAWSGVVVTPDSVYQAITSLRRLLGDDARQPTYIVNVPRLGYRLVATVTPWVDEPPPSADVATVSVSSTGAATADSRGRQSRRRIGRWVGAGIALALVLTAGIFIYGKVSGAAGAPARSVAVLPFLDLTTQEMNEEYFADGMTEELIGRLSKVPGFRVPAPTASFYFKVTRIGLRDVAKSLGVTSVLDGSVRKSDTTLRIAARLVRADDGYVIWSATYDRPAADKLKVQDEIASQVTEALSVSIH